MISKDDISWMASSIKYRRKAKAKLTKYRIMNEDIMEELCDRGIAVQHPVYQDYIWYDGIQWEHISSLHKWREVIE